jgi:bis(5'-nucleosyl)-tetraphosphatase (symmetrical)
MRFCDADGKLDFKQKGSPTVTKGLYKGLYPWFTCPSRRSFPLKILFGHWSTLVNDSLMNYYHDSNVLGLDTGCLWGKRLTIARLDTEEPIVIQMECDGCQKP